MHVGRIAFSGTWQGTGQRRPLAGINQQPRANQTVLFTPAWGAATPNLQNAAAVVLEPFPAAAVNTDLTATVSAVSGGLDRDPGRRRRARRDRNGGGEAAGRSAAGHAGVGPADPAGPVGVGHLGARRRAAARQGRQARLPDERGLRRSRPDDAPAARGRRPARRRRRHPRRRRRRASGLQRRHDELRARPDDGGTGRGDRSRAPVREVRHRRLRRSAPQPPEPGSPGVGQGGAADPVRRRRRAAALAAGRRQERCRRRRGARLPPDEPGAGDGHPRRPGRRQPRPRRGEQAAGHLPVQLDGPRRRGHLALDVQATDAEGRPSSAEQTFSTT